MYQGQKKKSPPLRDYLIIKVKKTEKSIRFRIGLSLGNRKLSLESTKGLVTIVSKKQPLE